MDDEKAEIKKTIRMGPSDYQLLVDYSEDHPELGGESNIIRTAIKEYIKRDARCTPVSDKEKGIFVPLSEKVLVALHMITEKGLQDTEAEVVKYLVTRALDPVDGPYAKEFAKALEQCDLTP
ncbi:MAG: hypothetical protein FWG58_02420 [Methanomassiliicoccaceae archaeon]|nr:hypothetical protein [Methanomassiliicoccaceae archaeon]